MKLNIHNESLTLLPEKALFLDDYGVLLLADMHFGKVSHFRKSGIAVPKKVVESNWEKFIRLLQHVSPERVVFLGDLFHSFHNTEWEEFRQIIESFPAIRFELVEGNHDIMSRYQYEKTRIRVFPELRLGSLLLSHEPVSNYQGPEYNLAGHLHPGVKLRGKARQALVLPCFWFGKHQGILPAFGKFTGLARIRPGEEDRVISVAGDKLVQLN